LYLNFVEIKQIVALIAMIKSLKLKNFIVNGRLRLLIMVYLKT